MRAKRWAAIGISAAVCAMIVAWITIRRSPATARVVGARPAPAMAPPPRWAAPAASSAPGIDLQQLRARLPGSAFWRDDAPTSDPAAAARRAEEARRWNDLYGKVLAGEASAEEIDGYYRHLERRSQDYLQVAEAALAQPLPERERALFTLAARMNRDRLAALPGERAAAFDRKRLQDQRRARWRGGR
jgi:hypothetical protein